MIDLAYNQTHSERLKTVGQEIRHERDQMQYVWKKDNIRRKHDKEDYLLIRKEWGYFSRKDGKRYTIRMCEECFDRFVDDCVVSPEIDDVTEYA